MTKLHKLHEFLPAAKDGKNGNDSVIYYLTSGALSIHVKDNVSNDPPFQVDCYKKVGDAAATIITVTLKTNIVGYSSSPTTRNSPLYINPSGMSRTFQSGATAIHLEAIVSNDVVAQLDIPIIRDGEDGKDGQDGLRWNVIRGQGFS